MNRKIISPLIIALFLISFVRPIVTFAAPVSYEYAGNYFDFFVDEDYPPPFPYDVGNRLVASFVTHEGLLPDSTILQDITPFISSWSLSDGVETITNNSPNLGSSTWLATVTGGAIIEWDVSALLFSDPPSPWSSKLNVIATRNNPIHPLFQYVDVGEIFLFQEQSSGLNPWDALAAGAIYENPAVWSKSVIPEPATMLLFGFGLLGLAGVSRRKK